VIYKAAEKVGSALRAFALSVLVVVLLLPAAPGAAQANHPADQSNPVAWYVERGAPSPDRTWSPADYDQLWSVLSPLALGSPLQLPRLRSQLSGPLFRRSIDAANLEMLRSAPPAARMSMVLGYTQTSRKLFGMYLECASRGLVFDEELTGLMGFMLALVEATVNEGEALLAAFPANDPQRSTREAGLAQVKSGLANMVAGALTTIGERHTYRDSARADLVASLQTFLPRLFHYLTDTQRSETLATLKRLEEREHDAALKRALGEMRARLG